MTTAQPWNHDMSAAPRDGRWIEGKWDPTKIEGVSKVRWNGRAWENNKAYSYIIHQPTHWRPIAAPSKCKCGLDDSHEILPGDALRAQIEGLKDPATVYSNMLRGTIAMPKAAQLDRAERDMDEALAQLTAERAVSDGLAKALEITARHYSVGNNMERRQVLSEYARPALAAHAKLRETKGAA